MGSLWFYSKNGQQFGPMSGQALKQLAERGELSPSDVVWKEGMKTGKPASKIVGLFADTSQAQSTATTSHSSPPPTSATVKIRLSDPSPNANNSAAGFDFDATGPILPNPPASRRTSPSLTKWMARNALVVSLLLIAILCVCIAMTLRLRHPVSSPEMGKAVGWEQKQSLTEVVPPTKVAQSRPTMDELVARMRAVHRGDSVGGQVRGYDLDEWMRVIGPPDEERGDLDFKRWVYKCSDGLLIIEIQNELLHQADTVFVIHNKFQKKPYP